MDEGGSDYTKESLEFRITVWTLIQCWGGGGMRDLLRMIINWQLILAKLI